MKKRILVIRIGRLGDTILATPVIEVLRQAYGADTSIDFVTSPGASAFVMNMDQRVDRIFPLAHRRIPWRVHSAKRALEKHSREQPYDLVINLECGSECDDFVRFIHYKDFCGRPLVEPAHRSDRHCVDTEKTIYAELLGHEITAGAKTSLQLTIEPQSLPVSLGTGYIVLNPGFSGVTEQGYRSHRGWPMQHWQTLIELLTNDRETSVLINGTAEEAQYFSSLLEHHAVHSMFGSTLPALAAALSGARCLISVDTGTMHLAAALGTPVIALFGPSNFRLTGPYSSSSSHRVLLSGVNCQPCVNTAEQKSCTTNRCMIDLEPEQVFEASRQMIAA